MEILYTEGLIIDTVMGVMKMGNIVPRAGLKPTSLAFWASMLPLHQVGSLTALLYRRPPVYVALLPQGSVQTTILPRYHASGYS